LETQIHLVFAFGLLFHELLDGSVSLLRAPMSDLHLLIALSQHPLVDSVSFEHDEDHKGDEDHSVDTVEDLEVSLHFFLDRR